jgi:hypothetical protein
MNRSRFLTFGLGMFALIGTIIHWPLGIKRGQSCKDMPEPKGDNLPHKFLNAFTQKKFKDLPANPVSY